MSELGKDARALIDAARSGDEPGPGDKQRLRAAIVSSLAATAAGASVPVVTKAAALEVAGSSLATVGGASLLKKALAVTLVAGALGGGWVATLKQESPSPTAASSAPQASPVDATNHGAPPLALPPSMPALEAEEGESISVESAVAPPSPPSRPAKPLGTDRRAEVPHPAAPTNLAEELAILKSAQSALRDGDFGRARALAEEHLSRFPRGALRLEAQATRWLARCASEPRHTLTREVKPFLDSAARSPLADKVREACVPDRADDRIP